MIMGKSVLILSWIMFRFIRYNREHSTATQYLFSLSYEVPQAHLSEVDLAELLEIVCWAVWCKETKLPGWFCFLFDSLLTARPW